MGYVLTFVFGLLAGAGLVWGFRGWVQRKKDAAAAELRKLEGKS